jgi:glycosyltransferase involved in cell wall biosynthesis
MRKIKIAQVINSLKPGGGERFLVDLLQALSHDEFQITVFCLYSKGELARELEHVGIPVNELKNIPRRVRLQGYVRLYNALKMGAFDIVHCHLLESCWYGLPAGWFAGVPIRIAHLQNCHWRLSLRARLFDRFAFAFADAAFGCSKAVLRFYQRRMWYPMSKCYLVYNGVATKRFENLPPKEEIRRALDLPQKCVIVTTVARLTPQKGHVFLLKAAREIVSKFKNVRFLLVGDGVLRTQLERHAAELGLTEHVFFLGRRTDVPQILAASDIFVLPSLWEGLPLVLVEAGLAGLPVVATRVDGVAEVVENGRSGLLVPPGDSHALAEALQTLLVEGPPLWERMGKEGRQIALQHFTMECIASQVADLYRKLLNRKVKRLR